jgi:hypothetical protein
MIKSVDRGVFKISVFGVDRAQVLAVMTVMTIPLTPR